MTLRTAKYPRTPIWPGSPSADRDDRIIMEPRIFIGQPVTITEKLDGANLLLHQGRVHTRTASKDAASPQPWTAMARKHHAWKLANPELQHLMIYAEDIYAVHSIEYDPMPEDQTLRAFASKSQAHQYFDSFDQTQAIADRLNIPTVPVLYQGTPGSLKEIQEILDQAHSSPSKLGPRAEGAVIRTTGAFPVELFHKHVCKSVRRNHVTTQEHWTRNWRPHRTLPPQGPYRTQQSA